MDRNHVSWLLNELDILTEKNIITHESARKIAEYYKPPVPQTKGRMRMRKSLSIPSPAVIKSIPVLLSIIASVLIAAGVISLIAYNWNAIPRTVKAFSAFLLLLVIQSGGVFINCSQKLYGQTAWREGTAAFWSLMFGGVIAYISQICRLPGDTASFLLVWTASSILLTYIMSSISSFVLSLFLSAGYVIICRQTGGNAFIFYLLFVLLVPFSFKFKYGRHIMLCFAAAMLNVVMEHSIPGLSAVASVSFAVFALEYGITSESRGIRRIAAAGLCITLTILSFSDLWRRVGWNHVYQDYSLFGILTDCIITTVLTLVAALWQFIPFLRKKRFPKWQIVYPLCAITVCILFVSCSIFSRYALTQYAAPVLIVFLFSILFLVHTVYSRKLYSVFLLFFLCASSCIAPLNMPVLAVALLILLVCSTGVYKESFLRAAVIVLILTATVCLTLDMDDYVIFRLQALPFHAVLYALYAVVAAILLFRSRMLSRFPDIAGACAAVIITTVLHAAFKMDRDVICTVYFFIVLACCAYHVVLYMNISDQKNESTYYWIPFVLTLVYFLWSAVFVMKINYPVLASGAFLLLFAAAGCYYIGAGTAYCITVRILTAVWSAASLWMCQNDNALAVYSSASVPFQIAVYIIIALCALILLIVSGRWKQFIDVPVIMSACVLSCVLKVNLNLQVESFIYHFTAAGLFGFIRLHIYKDILFTPYTVLFAGVLTASLCMISGSYIPVMSVCTLFYLCARDYSCSYLWDVPCVVIIYASAFVQNVLGFDVCPAPSVTAAVLTASFCFMLMILLPSVSLILKKKRFNFVFAVHSILILSGCIILLFSGLVSLRYANEALHIINPVLSVMSFACIFLCAGYYIWESYQQGKVALANIAALYAAIALVIKFFSDDYGFVAKGILFITLGVAMLVLNILLHRQEGKQ